MEEQQNRGRPSKRGAVSARSAVAIASTDAARCALDKALLSSPPKSSDPIAGDVYGARLAYRVRNKKLRHVFVMGNAVSPMRGRVATGTTDLRTLVR